ncbi:MAG: hypothetical protein IMZ66_01975, partial [Planctomycetes bacterium]|nr:hypothetical protein [Planctomycetota bacterium]
MAENTVYLDLGTFEDGKALRGGALVVDPSTEPLEFRCTDAVRPTNLQRVLWGKRLDGHIAVNLMAVPLLRAITQKYSLVVAQGAQFSELRACWETPVVVLVRGSAVEFANPPGAAPDGPHEGKANPEDVPELPITNTAGRFEPIIIRCHPRHPEDME